MCSSPRCGQWYTGGSGILLSASAVERIASATRDDVAAWGYVGGKCRCGDVPLACALVDLRIERRHRPDLFLDSCATCGAFMPSSPRRILSCHAAEAFHATNVHAKHKANYDAKAMMAHGVLLQNRGFLPYVWYKGLNGVPHAERMRTVRRECAPRG